MKKVNPKNDESKDKNTIGFVVAIVIAIVVIFLLIVVYNAFFN